MSDTPVVEESKETSILNATILQHANLLFNDKTAGKILSEVLKINEFDLLAINEDLTNENGYVDSFLAEELDDELPNFSQEEIYKILRIIFNIDHENTSATISNLIWKVTKEEIEKCREDIIRQCPYIINHCEDEDMIKIMAIGRKNGINLLSLLFDIYTKYRISSKLQKITAVNDENSETKNEMPSDFCGPSDFVNQLNIELTSLQKTEIISALNSYKKRMIPEYTFDSRQLIDDDCNVYIEYTLMIAHILQEYLMENYCLPLQVDMVIIPKELTTVDENDTDTESDDDEDEDTKESGNDSSALICAEMLEKEIINVLTENNVLKQELTFVQPLNVEKDENTAENDNNKNTAENDEKVNKNINTSDDNNVVFVGSQYRWLSKSIPLYIDGKQFKRLSVVIDRRTKPNTLYVYVLPDEHGIIPTDYFTATLTVKAGTVVIPYRGKHTGKQQKYIGGKYGECFQVSFQLLSEDQIRLHWFFAGSGMRLFPELMVKIWPSVFKNKEINERYTAEFIKKQFKLNVDDKMYDEWARNLIPETTTVTYDG